MAVGPDPGKTRRDNFNAYYKANPDKLKGKSLDEAYAAMQRESGRIQQRTNNSNKHSFDPQSRAAAIQRRIQNNKDSNDNPMTMKNTNPLSGVKNPLAIKNGKTPWQRLNGEINNAANAFNKNAQTTINKNPLAHMGNPLANKNGQTPIDRLMGRKRSTPNKPTSRKNMTA
jgi:hypothetical protein